MSAASAPIATTSRALFALPPEWAHAVAMHGARAALRLPMGRRLFAAACAPRHRHPLDKAGLRLPGRIGVAAGFDKDGRWLEVLDALGFDFVEVGSVTARPSPGRARPRVVRLPAERALLNWMGLPSEGAAVVAARLARVRPRVGLGVLVNVAKTPGCSGSLAAAIDDYVTSVRLLAPHCDGIVLNASCPNTEDGRTFEEPAPLRDLVEAVTRVASAHGRSVLVKVSPDLTSAQLEVAARAALEAGARGFVATNTTRQWDPAALPPRVAQAVPPGAGGLSGAPLRARALEAVATLRRVAGLAPVVIGVGGIFGPSDVGAFRDVGADAVEVFTGFVYGGPRTARRLATGWRSSSSPR